MRVHLDPSLLPAQPESPEHGAWDGVRSGWRLLFGGFASHGVSIELHDFAHQEEIDWGRSFHRRSVELCLNLSGNGRLQAGRNSCELTDRSAACYSIGDEAPRAVRVANHQHRFLTVEFQQTYLAKQLGEVGENIDPVLRQSRAKNARGRKNSGSSIGQPKRLTSAQQLLAQRLSEPPVTRAALPLWYEAKVLELIAEFLFVPEPELFCHRHQRLAKERVERVQEILRQRFEAPPGLEELGREVGVSQYYLSRIFSQETQMTIPQYLRQVRMEAAAKLLRAGTHNVTEAAFAVGYSSLGNFSKSFCEVVGCCPTLYPLAKNLLPRV